jgi:hypothetical protein
MSLNFYKIEDNGSISCLQENCKYKYRNPKNHHKSILDHYNRTHKDYYEYLKKYVVKPYSKPLSQNTKPSKDTKLITYTEEEQQIMTVYATKLLVSSIYRYMLLSLKLDTDFDILIIDNERTIFKKYFQKGINCFNTLNKDFKTSEENLALINESKTKIELVKTKQELLDYLDLIFSKFVLSK